MTAKDNNKAQKNFLCPKCHAENDMANKFCTSCGTRLAKKAEIPAVNCHKCSKKNVPGYRYCGYCGVKIQFGCPNCGKLVPPDSRYCPNCAFLCGEGRYKEA